jgi:MFS family permease
MPFENTARDAVYSSDAEERQPLLGPTKLIDHSSSPSTGTVAADFSSGKWSLRVILPALMVCAFLAAFDVTVVAAIYPIMFFPHLAPAKRILTASGSDFKGSNRVSWIAVAYILSNTACQPLYGRLSDIFGRRPCLIFANVVFGIGTLGCALAPGLWSLVISRMVAGIGGGGLNVLVVLFVPQD